MIGRMSFLLYLLAFPMVLVSSPLRAEDSDDKPRAVLAISADANWRLRLPATEKVPFRGAVSFDEAGLGPGGAAYPGQFGVAGFLAAIFAHAAVDEASKDSQKAEMRESADKVLLSYRAVIDSYTLRDLAQKAVSEFTPGASGKIVEMSEKSGADWYVEAGPMYSLTQDQRTLVLDNVVLIYASGGSEPAYKNVIRIVSNANEAPDPVKFWTDNSGQQLKNQSAKLYAESLGIAFADAARAGTAELPQRTVRYMEGTKEKMERAGILSEHCGRIVLVNLRGWLMSVPAKADSAKAKSGCAAASF